MLDYGRIWVVLRILEIAQRSRAGGVTIYQVHALTPMTRGYIARVMDDLHGLEMVSFRTEAHRKNRAGEVTAWRRVWLLTDTGRDVYNDVDSQAPWVREAKLKHRMDQEKRMLALAVQEFVVLDES